MSYIETWQGTASLDTLKRDLAAANDFTDADLAENRAGRISNRQMVKLGFQALKPLCVGVATMFGWLIFLEVLDRVIPDVVKLFLPAGAASYLVITIGAVIGLLIGLLNTTRITAMLLIDLKNGKIGMKEGRVSPSCEEVEARGMNKWRGEKAYLYRYFIKDDGFEVEHAGWELLRDKYEMSPACRVFYTPKSKLLLSVEPL